MYNGNLQLDIIDVYDTDEYNYCESCKYHAWYDAPMCANKECNIKNEKIFTKGIWVDSYDFWLTCEFYERSVENG